MVLTKQEYTWAITYESADDGARVVHSYWTSVSEANTYCSTHAVGKEQAVVQCELWKDNNGGWWLVSLRPVSVDMEKHRVSALAKLTPDEKRALGLV